MLEFRAKAKSWLSYGRALLSMRVLGVSTLKVIFRCRFWAGRSFRGLSLLLLVRLWGLSWILQLVGSPITQLLVTVPSRLANISTRGFVGAGDMVSIGGFIITDGGKTVFMDAKGPSLAALASAIRFRPRKLAYTRAVLIASNNGWRNNANVAEIIASGIAPTNDKESALQVALEPGAYTVIVSSGDGWTGIGSSRCSVLETRRGRSRSVIHRESALEMNSRTKKRKCFRVACC